MTFGNTNTPRGCGAFARNAHRSALLCALATVFGASLGRNAFADFVDEFTGPAVGWQLAEATPTQRLVDHRRLNTSPSGSDQLEHLGLQIAPGLSAPCTYSVGTVPVVDETHFECRVRSNQPGLQLALRVLLPRSRDVRTGQPLVTLIHGSRYAVANQWESLRIEQLPLLVERSARMLRVAPGQQVDTREAAITHVVMLVPGGTGVTSVDIDQLTMVGIDDPTRLTSAGQGPQLSAASGTPAASHVEPIEVSIEAATLRIAQQAVLPRLVEYRGEPLELIAELGFNGLWLTASPSESLVQAADRAHLWIVAPPPAGDELAKVPAASSWRAVLAWNAGVGIDANQTDMMYAACDAIRGVDRELQRPLLAEQAHPSGAYRRMVDVTVRPLSGASRSRDVSQAVETTRSAIGPGNVLLASHSLSLPGGLRSQCEALGVVTINWADSGLLRDQILTSLASGSRGYLIRTPQPLSSRDTDTKRIAGQLAAINRQVQLAEPWLLRGTSLGTLSDASQELTIHLLQLARTRLAIVTRNDRRATGELAANTSRPITLPGVPLTAGGYCLAPGSVQQLELVRVAGGVQVNVDAHLIDSFWLLTDDAQAVQQLRQHARQQLPYVTRVARGRAHAEVESFRTMHEALPKHRQSVAACDLLPLMNGLLSQCDLALSAGQFDRALTAASEVTLRIEQATIVLQRQLVTDASTCSSPLAALPSAWPAHVNLMEVEGRLTRGGNRLYGGDFEDLTELQQQGWKHTQLRDSVQLASVSISPAQPNSGGAVLRIETHAKDGAVDTEPTVWVESPEVSIERGELVEISGFARVTPLGDVPLTLHVSDSLGGTELGLPINQTTSWQPFRLLRRAASKGTIRVVLSVQGQGTVDIDSVMIRPLLAPSVPAAGVARQPVTAR